MNRNKDYYLSPEVEIMTLEVRLDILQQSPNAEPLGEETPGWNWENN